MKEIRHCAICGKAFTAIRRHTRYCGEECRYTAQLANCAAYRKKERKKDDGVHRECNCKIEGNYI